MSPVDGFLSQQGEIERGLLLQTKGIFYSVSRLLADEAEAKRFEGGKYFTFYLSPSNYHRVHNPFDGQIVRRVHIPGMLWPVNNWGVARLPGVFVECERVVTILNSESGRFAVVMVGATNVGSINLSYDSLITNSGRSLFQARREVEVGFCGTNRFAKGCRDRCVQHGVKCDLIAGTRLQRQITCPIFQGDTIFQGDRGGEY